MKPLRAKTSMNRSSSKIPTGARGALRSTSGRQSTVREDDESDTPREVPPSSASSTSSSLSSLSPMPNNQVGELVSRLEALASIHEQLMAKHESLLERLEAYPAFNTAPAQQQSPRTSSAPVSAAAAQAASGRGSSKSRKTSNRTSRMSSERKSSSLSRSSPGVRSSPAASEGARSPEVSRSVGRINEGGEAGHTAEEVRMRVASKSVGRNEGSGVGYTAEQMRTRAAKKASSPGASSSSSSLSRYSAAHGNTGAGEGYEVRVCVRKRPAKADEQDSVRCHGTSVTALEDKVKVGPERGLLCPW